MVYPFEFIHGFADTDETTGAESTAPKNIITAYQIIRVVKSAGGFHYRTILDTLHVVGDVDHTRKRAIVKAQRLGRCMVIELSEKVVSTVDKKE